MLGFGFGSGDFDDFRLVVDDDVDCDGEEDANEVLFDSIPEFVCSAVGKSAMISDGTRTESIFMKIDRSRQCRELALLASVCEKTSKECRIYITHMSREI